MVQMKKQQLARNPIKLPLECGKFDFDIKNI